LLHHPVVIAPGAPVLEIAGIVRSSVVDGPGNRYVLFLQGCNFDCTACHNPSTIGRCDACGACVPACPHGALSFPGPGTIAFAAGSCDGCRACIALCPIDADPAIRVASVTELVAEIRTVAPFLNGITVSGGEPTTQFDGLLALLRAVKADPTTRHLTTLVDSNGTLPVGRWQQLLPVLDGAMLDLKAGTEGLHRLLTGHPSDAVRDSIRFLAGAGRLAEVRLLVVEGITDTPAELEAWKDFVAASAPGVPVRLMAFRHQGTRERARAWPETTPAAIEGVRARLAASGFAQIITV
jgi:YjjW family glycine radical enzyme activase